MTNALRLVVLLALGLVAAAAAFVVALRPREAQPFPPSRLEGIVLKEPAPGGLGPEAVAGRRVFERECAVCHGAKGGGDGFNAYNLQALGARPRDLSDPLYQDAAGDYEIERAIRLGGYAIGRSRLMPPYGRTLSDAEIGALVARIRSLRRLP